MFDCRALCALAAIDLATNSAQVSCKDYLVADALQEKRNKERQYGTHKTELEGEYNAEDKGHNARNSVVYRYGLKEFESRQQAELGGVYRVKDDD